MGNEIERKFLVNKAKLDTVLPKNGEDIVQGYLTTNTDLIVKIEEINSLYYIAISNSILNKHYKYEIPEKDYLKLNETLASNSFIHTTKETVVRSRTKGNKAYLTIKGANIGIERPEFEYPIPFEEAEEIIFKSCGSDIIEKTRYEIPLGKHIWEVDIFSGNNLGLILAEIELSQITEEFDKPFWIVREVSEDKKYFNSNLIKNPMTPKKIIEDSLIVFITDLIANPEKSIYKQFLEEDGNYLELGTVWFKDPITSTQHTDVFMFVIEINEPNEEKYFSFQAPTTGFNYFSNENNLEESVDIYSSLLLNHINNR